MDIRFYFSFFLVYLKQNKFLNPFFTPLHAVYLSLLLFLILVAHIPINAVMLPLCCVSHQNIVSFIFHHRFFIVKCVCVSLQTYVCLQTSVFHQRLMLFFSIQQRISLNHPVSLQACLYFSIDSSLNHQTSMCHSLDQRMPFHRSVS